ncbi:MAG: nicotinamide riboside transporter PnuC [Steroidobacteraceae bacterium]
MLEYVAAAFGAAYIVLAILQLRACWIAGCASTALAIVVFIETGLPLQAALQILYVILAVYGWVAWRPGGDAPARPQSWPLSRHVIALAAVVLASAVSAPLLARFGASAAPVAESLGTWASVAATWMLARRCIESWLWWIVIDAGLAVLFAQQGLLFFAALYAAFGALAVVGWRSWRRSQPVAS